MPLSEDEQRILQDIERTFYEQDPKFARSVTHQPDEPKPARSLRLCAAGFIAGLVLTLATFLVLPVVAIVGFVLMSVSAGLFVQSYVRRHTPAGGSQDDAPPAGS